MILFALDAYLAEWVILVQSLVMNYGFLKEDLHGMQPDRRPSVVYWPVQQYGSKGNQHTLIVPALGLTSSPEYNEAISDFDFDRAPES